MNAPTTHTSARMERVSTMMAATAVIVTRDTAANFAKVNFRAKKKRLISNKMSVCKNLHAARPLSGKILYIDFGNHISLITNYRGRRVCVIAVPKHPIRV